jgi:hypothetical protein
MNWVAEHQWNNLQERLGFSGSSEGLEDALYLKLKTLRKQSGRMPHACDSCRHWKRNQPDRVFSKDGICFCREAEDFCLPCDWSHSCGKWEGE